MIQIQKVKVEKEMGWKENTAMISNIEKLKTAWRKLPPYIDRKAK